MLTRFCQRFACLLLRLIFLPLNIKVESQEDLSKLKKPLIIAANHTAYLDSFLIGFVFNKYNPNLLPIIFACLWKYYYVPIFWPFLKLLGVFPVRRGIGLDNTLKKGLMVLEKGGVVGVFPEGRRNHADVPKIITRKDTKGKRGAAYLSIRTKTAILPVLIKRTLDINWLRFFYTFKRQVVIVKIGKLFYPAAQDLLDLDPATIEIIEKIRGLG